MSGKPRCSVCGRLMHWTSDEDGWTCACEERGDFWEDEV